MSVLETPAHQRSNSRVPACSNVWLKCRRVATDSPNLANGVLDISVGGVQFLAKELLDAGDTIEIVLSSSSVRTAIRRNAEVRWVVAIGAEACCAGVRFHEPLSTGELQALIALGEEPSAADECNADLSSTS
jgi:c-di-GMP-binding flagellar brake protein YcgR